MPHVHVQRYPSDCPMLPSHRRLFCVAPVKLDGLKCLHKGSGDVPVALQDQLTDAHLKMDPGSPTDRAHVAETVKERVDVGTSDGW